MKNDEKMIDFAQRAVRTRSYSDEEGDFAQAAVAEMESLGYDQAFIDGTGNAVGIIGNGPEIIHFDSHMDTVRVDDPDEWDVPPFAGTIKDGYLWGRGSVDMRLFINTLHQQIAVLPLLSRSNTLSAPQCPLWVFAVSARLSGVEILRCRMIEIVVKMYTGNIIILFQFLNSPVNSRSGVRAGRIQEFGICDPVRIHICLNIYPFLSGAGNENAERVISEFCLICCFRIRIIVRIRAEIFRRSECRGIP